MFEETDVLGIITRTSDLYQAAKKKAQVTEFLAELVTRAWANANRIIVG
jgi:hypothetical protein